MGARCGTCGVPKLIGRTHVWRDGCIVERTSGLASLCVYEVDNHNSFVEEMGRHIGVPLDPIIYNASVHASRKVIRDMLDPHPVLAGLACSAPLYRLTERVICSVYRAIGAGGIELREREKGKRAKAYISHPCNLTQCLAITAGALQAVDGTRYSYEIVGDGGPTEVEYVPAPGREVDEETYERLGSSELTPGRYPVVASFNPCPRCGVPREVGETFSFDLSRGVIRKKMGGGRVILGGIGSFNAMFRELERELGESVDIVSAGIEKESAKKDLAASGMTGKAWDEAELRDHLALYGAGLLQEMRRDGDELNLAVANVYVPSLVAGRLAAIWENWHGEGCDYRFSVENNVLSLTIRPRT